MQFDSNLFGIGLIAIEKTVTRIKLGDFLINNYQPNHKTESAQCNI